MWYISSYVYGIEFCNKLHNCLFLFVFFITGRDAVVASFPGVTHLMCYFHVVKAYKRFKDKGFEVFGVSLDRNKEDWVKAIAEDGLTWTHVSDLKYFESQARQESDLKKLEKKIEQEKNSAQEKIRQLSRREFENRAVALAIAKGLSDSLKSHQLTEAVRRQPYKVVLFDEIEKAHPDVFNLLLQLLEDGHLTDSQGRRVDFKNTLIIMTSNIGSKVIEKGGNSLGFEMADDFAQSRYQQISNRVTEELKQYFRPEFLNRLDEIIVFRQLTREEVTQIADILIADLAKQLTEKGISVEVTAAFKDLVINEGYDPSYGARPLRRALTRRLEDSCICHPPSPYAICYV